MTKTGTPTNHDYSTGAEDRAECLRKALELLARREHFSGELQKKLTARGWNSDCVLSVLAELRETGYLNDLRALEHLAREVKRKRKGRLYLRAAAYRKAGPELTDRAALDNVYTSREEQSVAESVAASHTFPADFLKQRRYLANRGFTMEVVRAVTDVD